MGKGSSPSNNTAVKSARAITVGSEAGGASDQSANVCHLRFTMSLLLKASLGIAVGDTVAIVPNATDSTQLDIIIGRTLVGLYGGEYRQRIIDCIGENYTYRGEVTEIKAMGPALEVICTVRWHTYE